MARSNIVWKLFQAYRNKPMGSLVGTEEWWESVQYNLRLLSEIAVRLRPSL